MSFQKLPLRPMPRCRALLSSSRAAVQLISIRHQSTAAFASNSDSDLNEFAPDYSSHSTPSPTAEQIAAYDPIARSRSRTSQLPPTRYQYRSPRYYRGPLHPHQPPPASDPSSRTFVPGPFSNPRLLQTYNTTVASDIMVLSYEHVPPGTVIPEPAPRLRAWDDSSPYNKNRPLRGPRGREYLPLMRKPITFRNVPELTQVTVSSLIPDAASSSAHLHVGGMVLQAITTKRARVNLAKSTSNAGQRAWFTQKQGKPISLNVTLKGEEMWHFFSTLTAVVLPKIKDWSGMGRRSGDGSGNLGLGLTAESVGLWPEIAINYDSYPPEMIPSMHIIFHTSASTDKDARVLIGALGMPFSGAAK